MSHVNAVGEENLGTQVKVGVQRNCVSIKGCWDFIPYVPRFSGICEGCTERRENDRRIDCGSLLNLVSRMIISIATRKNVVDVHS